MKIDRKALCGALESVKPGLAKDDSILEQASSFAFMGNRIVTYNDTISISAEVPGLDLYGAIKAEDLYKFIKKLKKDEIEISLGDNQVLIKSGRSKAGLNIYQTVVLPVKDELGTISQWYDLPPDFITGVSLAYPLCSKDLTKPKLLCVHIREDGIIEASDGYRIMQYNTGDGIPVGDFLLIKNTARSLCSYGVTQIAQTQGWTHFRTGDKRIIFSCRMFNDVYPDTSGFFKVKGTEIKLPKTLKDALELGSVFSNNTLDAVDMVDLLIEDRKLLIRAENENGSWFEEPLNIRYEGEPIAFSIPPTFLIELLNKCDSCILNDNTITFKGDKWTHVVALRIKED